MGGDLRVEGSAKVEHEAHPRAEPERERLHVVEGAVDRNLVTNVDRGARGV